MSVNDNIAIKYCHSSVFKLSGFVSILNSFPFYIKDNSLPVDEIYIIWLKDFYLRLNELDIGEVKEMLKEDNIDLLMESDQLKQQQQQRRAFTEFTEGKIKFIPTYKYDIGKLKRVHGNK